MRRATAIFAALSFAAVAGAQQPAKPAAMKHDSTKAKAEMAKPAAAPAKGGEMAKPAAAPAKGEMAKKDTTKKPAAMKKPGV
jgi:hypothetical protein